MTDEVKYSLKSTSGTNSLADFTLSSNTLLGLANRISHNCEQFYALYQAGNEAMKTDQS